jgi:phosphate transport system permease protein
MTDVTVFPGNETRRLDLTSDEARARVRRRYRAESRFRFYGIAAIVVTAVFLVILIADILIKGLPAFTQHSITVDVPITAELADPQGNRSQESLRSGDYAALVRNAVKQELGVDGRVANNQISKLLSTSSGDGLRDAVLADPNLIGQTVKTTALLSDDSDLYYKGVGTEITRSNGQTTATPSDTKGEITITAPGAFAANVAVLQDVARKKLAGIKDEIAHFEASSDADFRARATPLKEEAAAIEAVLADAASSMKLDTHLPSVLVAINGGMVKLSSMTGDVGTGSIIVPLKSADAASAGQWQLVTYVTPEADRKVDDFKTVVLDRLQTDGKVSRGFNTIFFTAGDSREPELAGIRGALFGSILTLAVTLALCLPVGVMAAIYLEEFAKKNWFTDLIEININNLAAVPSIVFGLLGLAVFLNFFGLHRSAPLVGGLVLALLVLPTIIIASRAALRAVPPSIKEAALGVGASHQQAIFHHVLPLAMPGIMTGTIIGMAHALGETAPLLMIGMVAFIVDIPTGFTDSATALPVQIYLWSDLPEVAFKQKTAAAIIVLLVLLFVMNGMAIWLRKRFERRW